MSKSCPLISILTPTWNRAEYLERVWSRIDSQTYRNIEWIVANDGSSDNTQKVIDGLAKQSNFPITFINASMRVGKPRMDNELMNHANGDFLIWNDSDDYLLPDALETLIGLWNDIPIEEREGYLGVMALCSDPQGRLQTHGLGNGSKRLDTTWEGIMANEIGDAAIMCRSDIVKDKRFLEVDFLITESSFWQNIYKNKRVVLLSKVVKVMDRTAPGSVSFGQKMEYNRGKAYAISLSDVGFHFYRRSLHEKFWKVINYWRYSILGEVGAIRSTQMWSVISSNPLYLLLYPIGGILALRDIVKGKVVWTHREFEYAKDNVKITVSKYGK